MPELIDKAKVLKYLTPRIKAETPLGEAYNRALEDAAALVALMPTIEAEPVRHGRWIECDYKTLENGETESAYKSGLCCSECRTGFKKNRMTYKAFCPACGAQMDATDTNVGGKGGDDNE
jgi:hypothetical protein